MVRNEEHLALANLTVASEDFVVLNVHSLLHENYRSEKDK
jgi:hypothetical protein